MIVVRHSPRRKKSSSTVLDHLEATKTTGLIGPWRGAWCVVETSLILGGLNVAAAPASLSRARGNGFRR
jgi:hypothetical protein